MVKNLKKIYFFQKINFYISFESSWRAESKNAKIFEKKTNFESITAYERVQKLYFWHFFAPQNVYQEMVRFGQTQTFLKACMLT